MYFSDWQFTADIAMISMNNPDNYGAFFWAFIVVNSLAIVIPLSKLIWMFVEEEQEEDGFLKMKTP